MYSMRQRLGLFTAPIAFILILLLPVPEGMKPGAMSVAAITVLMAILWISEAIPMPATALLPIVLFPLLGVMKSSAATAPYANQLIYLFMGGFFIAVTMEKWNLHRRIALNIINKVGTSPQRIILGFMVATALLSSFISNTATAMMMVPIAIAIVSQITHISPTQLSSGEGSSHKIAVALMLGIAWAASIGGMATIIGTPPNIVMVGAVESLYKVNIGFLQWMTFGVPLSLLLLVCAWFLITKVLFKIDQVDSSGIDELIRDELKKLGKTTKEEKLIITVGLMVGFLWISRGILSSAMKYNPELKAFILDIFPQFNMVHDATIGVFGALLLFIIPSNLNKGEFLLDWQTAVKIPWSIVLLFGGGLALAAGFQATSLTEYIAGGLTSLEGLSMLIFLLVVVGLTVFLTEVTSNTATATLLVPIMGATALAIGIHPFGPIIGACVAASCAFMLPVATPPNAVVFGSGCVTIPQMSRSGLYLNLVSVIVITLAVTYLLPLVWGIDLNTVPVEIQDVVDAAQASS